MCEVISVADTLEYSSASDHTANGGDVVGSDIDGAVLSRLLKQLAARESTRAYLNSGKRQLTKQNKKLQVSSFDIAGTDI